MKEQIFLIIINEEVYEIGACNQKEALIQAINQFQEKWNDYTDEWAKATEEIKKDMMSHDKLLRAEIIKSIRVYYK